MILIVKALRKIYRKFINKLKFEIIKKRNDNFYTKKFINILKKKYFDINTDEIKKALKKEIISSKLAFNFISLQENNNKILLNISDYQKSKIISDADNICNHKFNLLGSGDTHISYFLKKDGSKDLENKNEDSNFIKEYAQIKEKIRKKIFEIIDLNNFEYEPIDWQVDFKSGYRWNNKTWYKNIKYGQVLGADIKIPWELSRSNHFLTLGQAYYLTKDEKYTKEFICQFIDWIVSNPYEFGVNWACTMDVAIRACNWIFSLYFFVSSPLINEEFIFEFTKSLYFHGYHIKNNLENELFTVRGNHYLSNITGLLYLGVFFKEFKFGKKWYDFAIYKLKKEINFQVYDDGCNFEASTYYHRLVLELFFFSTIFTIKNSYYFKNNNWLEKGNEIFGNSFISKLQKMFYFILYAIKPDGFLPQIGDNDNGKLHNFNNENIRDVSYLLNLGAIFFNDNNLKFKEFKFPLEAYWIFGENALKIWGNLNSKSISEIKSKDFLDAGWFILRNNKNYMFVSAGNNGQNGLGGHAHNDKLSFELMINELDIIVDSGTYIYTSIPELRNKFRSTYSHNTAIINGEEQNRFKKNNLFYLENDAKIKINKWITNENYDFLEAQHNGYSRLEIPVIHKRKIIFDKINDFWIIKDIIFSNFNNKVKLNNTFFNIEIIFHLSPNIDYKVDFNNLLVEFYNNNIGDVENIENNKNLFLKTQISNDYKLSLKIKDDYISESYGKKCKNENLLYTINNEKLPIEVIFIISKEKNDFKELLNYYNNLLV